MIIFYILLLFIITLIGASLPIWYPKWDAKKTSLLLAFSGTFLLGITLMHLIPENIHHHASAAPVLITVGFFLQLFLQRFTHGIEHGHIHTTHGSAPHGLELSFLIGLSLHAFSEGLPLGIVYHDEAVLPSLFFAIALHKIPEAMLLSSLLMQYRFSRKKVLSYIIIFSTITPISVMLTRWLGDNVASVQQLVSWCLPLVAGSFLQISTTVLYESGTKNHEMKNSKWMALLLGFILAIITSFFTTTHQH